MADRREVALGLMRLAIDILTFDRKMPEGAARHYQSASRIEPGPGLGVPVVPPEVHAVICPSVAVLLDDETEQVFVCASCRLAVETGPGS